MFTHEGHDGQPLLLTVNEACAMLRISRPTMYQLLNSGRVGSIQIGRARRIPRSELERLAASFEGHGGSPDAA